MQIMHLGALILAAVLAHVRTHAYGRTHMGTNTHIPAPHAGNINEYVCPAEGGENKDEQWCCFTSCLLQSTWNKVAQRSRGEKRLRERR